MRWLLHHHIYTKIITTTCLFPRRWFSAGKQWARVSWEGCTGYSAPIPQCYACHHIIRRDAWGQGRTTTKFGFTCSFKVVLEFRVTLFKSIDFKAAWSLSQNTFVCKFSVQGNLYLARYKQLKFRLQGKFCRKITTTNGSFVIGVYESIPYGMRIWQFAISSFDCEIITSHILFA